MIGVSDAEPMLLNPAWSDDRHAFQELAEPYRRQLQAHCYRMLGSLQEAEDLVQDAFLRAWRARGRFEGRTSFRNWLYRIATNACSSALAARSSARPWLPDAYGPSTDRLLEGTPATEVAWLEPYPDLALDDIADSAPSPDARYELRESVHLAFIAAIQQLPPRQRAVLLLRDVLGWSAAETAQLMDASLASVNSALQRARATLETRFPAGQPSRRPATNDLQRDLLERYVQSWEAGDIDGFVGLLKHDAVLSMPPWRQWYRGRDAIRMFFSWAWQPPAAGRFRLMPTGANGQPAFVHYSRGPHDSAFTAHGIQVLTVHADAVAALAVFRDPLLAARFGCPLPVPAA